MNRKRIAILADHFEALHAQAKADKKSAKKLNMSKWIVSGSTFAKEGVTIVKENGETKALLKEGYCNSVACVIGHATSNKSLRRQGLRMMVIYDPQAVEDGIITPHNFMPVLVKGGEIIAQDFNAVTEFFDMSISQAHLFFGKTTYAYTGDYSDDSKQPTLLQVAKRLRKLADTGE